MKKANFINATAEGDTLTIQLENNKNIQLNLSALNEMASFTEGNDYSESISNLIFGIARASNFMLNGNTLKGTESIGIEDNDLYNVNYLRGILSQLNVRVNN